MGFLNVTPLFMCLGYFKRWYNKNAMGKISTVVKNVIKSIKSDIRNVHFPLEETRGAHHNIHKTNRLEDNRRECL